MKYGNVRCFSKEAAASRRHSYPPSPRMGLTRVACQRLRGTTEVRQNFSLASGRLFL